MGLALSGDYGTVWVPGTALPGEADPASAEDTDREPFNYRETDSVDLWRRQYHETVATIIADVALQSSLSGGSAGIDCLGDEAHELFPPSGPLLVLAAKLPPWKEESAREKLSLYDTWTVLLEYLRLYECALTERYYYLFSDTILEQSLLSETEGRELTWGQTEEEYYDQLKKILLELDTARPTLERVIALHLDKVRLHALIGEIDCLERASKDLRIATALGAEAAACFPRVQDAKSPLRDLTEEE